MRRYRIIAVLLTAAVIAALVVYSSMSTPDMTAGWGQGKIAASERRYCENAFRRISDIWLIESWELKTPISGLIEAPYNTYLVIDVPAGEIYLEQNGQIPPANIMQLPKNMKWRFYRCTISGNTDLPPTTCFKIRGVRTSKEYPEVICLTGHSRGPDHLTFTVRSGNLDTNYGGAGPYPVADCNVWKEPSEPTYPSILVTEAEYAAYRDPNQPISRTEETYFDVEPGIYQQIEAHLNRLGFDLQELEITPGSDLNAAYAFANVEPKEPSFIVRYLKRSRPRQTPTKLIFKINHVADNLWYVKTAPYFKRDPDEETVSL
ncbi:MAG: hypothetical protein ACYS8Z_20965, partial [Planctomycetota bacterium]